MINDAQHRPVLYALAGNDADGRAVPALEAFDFSTNTWTTKAPVPLPAGLADGRASAAALGGRIYLAINARLFAYDPRLDTWSEPAGVQTSETLLDPIVGAINGGLYVLYYRLSDRRGVLYRYTPAKDTWTRLPNCPVAHHLGAAATLDGQFYVAGGATQSSGPPFATRALHAFDPATGQWSKKAPMLQAVAGAAATAIQERMFLLGGNDANAQSRDYVQVYDAIRNRWEWKAPLPSWRTRLSAASFFNVNAQPRVVAVGGLGGVAGRWLRSNDVYTP